MIQPPESGDVERRLRPLSTLIGQSLSRANSAARDFFASRGLPFEKYTARTLQRYFTRLYLEGAGYVVDDESEIAVEPKKLPNVGLQIVYDALSCRILKSTADQELPPPRTEARIAFYDQQLSFNLSVDEQAPYAEGNVTYLWDDQDETHELTHLWMIWTKSAVRGDVVEAWRIEIPLPPQAGQDRGPTLPTAPPPRRDLPIGIPSEDVASGPVD